MVQKQKAKASDVQYIYRVKSGKQTIEFTFPRPQPRSFNRKLLSAARDTMRVLGFNPTKLSLVTGPGTKKHVYRVESSMGTIEISSPVMVPNSTVRKMAAEYETMVRLLKKKPLKTIPKKVKKKSP